MCNSKIRSCLNYCFMFSGMSWWELKFYGFTVKIMWLVLRGTLLRNNLFYLTIRGVWEQMAHKKTVQWPAARWNIYPVVAVSCNFNPFTYITIAIIIIMQSLTWESLVTFRFRLSNGLWKDNLGPVCLHFIGFWGPPTLYPVYARGSFSAVKDAVAWRWQQIFLKCRI
jgi:hypothetical protein